MADRYCFVCDTTVDSELCPTCETETWRPPAHQAEPRLDDPAHLPAADPAEPDRPSPPLPPLPVVAPPTGADLPGYEAGARQRERSIAPARLVPIAALVVGGIIFLSVLTGPSGLEPEDETPVTPPITAQTTTTVPAPGSSRDVWGPPTGAWVGGFAFTAERPENLFGPSLAAGRLDLAGGTIVDSLPDGRLVGIYESDGVEEVVLLGTGESGQTTEFAPLPVPGPDSTAPLLSPNGTRLAMIDAAGVPYVWTIDGSSPPRDAVPAVLSPRDSASTAVEAIVSLTWSPDSNLLALNAFQGGYYLWDIETNELSRNPMPGRAVAVSNTRVAAWGGSGLELRDLTGRVLRRWQDLVPGEGVPLEVEGAFDPVDRYLAVRGLVGTRNDGQDGLTVLSTIGTTRRLLTTEPAQGFAWSGDGSGLYWLDSSGLQVWSADPERASASLLGGAGRIFPRLRVYDPAMTPLTHPALESAGLMELRDGIVTRRIMNGSQTTFAGMNQATIAPAGVGGRFLSVATGEFQQPVVLAEALGGGSQVLGNLERTHLGPDGRIVRTVALSPGDAGDLDAAELDATRWYVETDNGLILFGPDAGRFTTVAEGHSLGYLGGIAFFVTPDGSAIQTIPDVNGTETVLAAADLDAERIVAVAAVRRAVFVLLETRAGEVQIWQVPGDSELLTTPLFPPAPSITSSPWVVYTAPGPVTGGTILAEPNQSAGEIAAVRIDSPDGPATIVMASPLALESVCGASAGGTCVLFETSGRPLGFSPDGNWLLIESAGRYLAVSPVGRGSATLPDTPPDQVAWVEIGR